MSDSGFDWASGLDVLCQPNSSDFSCNFVTVEYLSVLVLGDPKPPMLACSTNVPLLSPASSSSADSLLQC